MQFLMLISNIMFISHENQVSRAKSQNTSAIFSPIPKKIGFLSEESIFFKTHASFFSPSLDGSNNVRKLEKCFETKHYIGLARLCVTVTSGRPC